MNREQKRKMRHLLPSNIRDTIDYNALEKINFARQMSSSENKIEYGDKVMIDFKRIRSKRTYMRLNPKYRSFLESHKHDIFTVEESKYHPNSRQIVALKEDPSEIKWDWLYTDLVKVQEKTNEFN